MILDRRGGSHYPIVSIPMTVIKIIGWAGYSHRHIGGLRHHDHRAQAQIAIHDMVGVVHVELVFLIAERSREDPVLSLIHGQIWEHDIVGIREFSPVAPIFGFSRQRGFGQSV